MTDDAEQAEQPAHVHDDPAVRAIVGPWWEARRPLPGGSTWEVPFPPRPTETARVTVEQLGSGVDAVYLWRACLVPPGAITAYIEVESRESPIAALVSLYLHVV